MFYKMIENKCKEWYSSDQCTVRNLIEYIEKTGQMRDAQIEAIKVYLFLKIGCECKPLEFLFRYGCFNSINLNDIELSTATREYLEDKLQTAFYGEIDAVIAFSRKVNLNFDCLRAIAFEINSGISFKEAISDLNIINTGDGSRYDAILHYKNGMQASCKDVSLDLFGDGKESFWLSDKAGYQYVEVTFDVRVTKFDVNNCVYVVTANNLSVRYDRDSEYEKLVKQAEETEVEYLSLSKSRVKNIHYII